jgi:predicted dithiol-disulfide oxidoreductase (DUF899 family)
LFEGRWQLITYHFMFDPTWDKGCPGCTGYANALGDLSKLYDHDTTFALISRAPLAKLEAYKAQMGWGVPWYSSFGLGRDALPSPRALIRRAFSRCSPEREGTSSGYSR